MYKFFITALAFIVVANCAYAQEERKQLPLMKLQKEKQSIEDSDELIPFQKGVIQYKSGNYVGCLQTMNEVIKNDPGNTLAHYYTAISHVKIGNGSAAQESYNNVLRLNPNSQVGSYARTGLTCLTKPDKCQVDMIEGVKNINNSLLLPVSENVKNTIQTNRLNHIKEVLNSGKEVEKEEVEKLDDFSGHKINKNEPSDEEVLKAIKVLRKAGINPLGNMTGANMYQNPDMMQMNMLLSSMGGNITTSGNTGYMNMMPMLMMQQDGKNVDPQLMETMINSMMMPDMFSSMSGFDKKD